jgi:hypothetical protein
VALTGSSGVAACVRSAPHSTRTKAGKPT